MKRRIGEKTKATPNDAVAGLAVLVNLWWRDMPGGRDLGIEATLPGEEEESFVLKIADDYFDITATRREQP